MNDTASQTKLNTPWDDDDLICTVSKKTIGIIAAVWFLCALGLPLCANDWVALPLLAVLFAFVALIARQPAVVTVLLASTFVVTLFGGSFWAGAVFLSVTVGCMAGAFLLTVRRMHPVVTPLLSLAAAAIAYAFTKDLALSALSLFCLPAAALIALGTRRMLKRTSTVLMGIGGLLFSVVILLAVTVFQSTGGLSRTCMLSFIDGIRNGVIGELTAVANEVLTGLQEMVTDEQTAEAYRTVAAQLSPEAITNAVVAVFNLLPALITVLCTVIGFYAQMLLQAAYRRVGLERVLTPVTSYLTVSLSAAVLYMLSFVLMLFIPANTMAYAVIQNLSLILLPALFLLGVQRAFASFATAKGGMRIFFLLFFVGILCCYPGGALMLLAMWGAYSRVAASIHKKLLEKMKQDGGPFDRD